MKNNKAGPDMTIDRKTIRNDIPGHHSYTNGLSAHAVTVTTEAAQNNVESFFGEQGETKDGLRVFRRAAGY